ncbi:MAG: membrane protein insertion efficiency factor YidD [Euzebyales bacterium]|nr:membrane protein insertion efficiency factor YidD [Euzebyales bacterium]MBA3621656.1 membrane protein insertion efficiency factor YidD [Euzebyales bacterium]
MTPLALLLSLLVRGYRLVPHFGPPRCRFYPSCSSYALQALQDHGGVRGTWLAIRRLGRCHPFHPGGVDHVPAPVAGGRRLATR